jgi:hypothetical protein
MALDFAQRYHQEAWFNREILPGVQHNRKDCGEQPLKALKLSNQEKQQ